MCIREHLPQNNLYLSLIFYLINGDLNVDLLRENNNKLLEIISELNLTNVIKEPTRNGALLDPIFE
jgi:hypothetical protein